MAKFRKGFHKGWLTEKALIELREDVVLDSIYTRDYVNRFNICPNQVSVFFDGYCDYLEELMIEDGKDGINYFFDYLEEYDTKQNLLNWYRCFDDNPFTKFVD